MTGAPARLPAPWGHAGLGALIVGLVAGPRAAPWVVAVLVLVVAGCGLAVGARAVTACLLAAAVALGAQAGLARTRALDHSDLGSWVAHVVRGEVTVLQAPRAQRDGGWTALGGFRGEPVLLRVSGGGAFGAVPRPRPRPRLPAVGAVLRVRAAVAAPDDYAAILRAHAVLRAMAVRVTGRRRGGALGVVDSLRVRALAALARGPDRDRAALLQGMVLGQDAALDPDVRDEVRAAGLSHLSAASGQNIVLLSTMVVAMSVLLGVPFGLRWAVVLLTIAVYVPLAGGGPSIQRAGIMGAAGVVALLAGRPAARWYALGLAASATLLLDPRAAADPGWQLSFVAVVALLLLGRPWTERLRRRGLPGPLAEAAAVTAAATLATAPVIATHFGTVAPASIPANLLVAPVVAPIMWLGVSAALAGQIQPGLAAVVDALADPLLRWVLHVAHVAANAPGAAVHTTPVVVAALTGCALVAVGGRAPWRVRVGRRRRIVLAVPALGCAAAVVVGAYATRPPSAPVPPPPAGLRVTFLDVGQGDATLVQVPGHAVLVDAGPPDGPVLARLREAGVRQLDLLVATHAQADHDGAAAAVLAALPVGLVLDGRDGVRSTFGDAMAAVARRRGVGLLPGRAGQVLQAGALRLRVLSPEEGADSGQTGADPNDRAIVLEASVTGGGGNKDREDDPGRVLLTADAESDVLSRLDLEPVDVLKVAHHGSADPGLPTLLERLTPLVAGIEVGAGNTYGHPSPATLKALAGVPRTVRTDRDGTVRADLGVGGWTVRRARDP